MAGAPDRNPIRLLVLTNMYPSAKRPSYGAFVRDQVESLRSVGVAPEVLFINGRTSRTEYLRALPRIHRAIRRGFDLIHAHYGLTGFFAVLQRRLPVVITYHGDDLLGTPGPRDQATRKSRVARVLSRWAAPRANAVVVVSPGLLSALPEGPARRRAHILPMGVDLARFTRVPRDEACRALGLDPEPKRVLFAADPGLRRKRHVLADAAVQRLRQVRPNVLLHLANGVPPERMPLVMSACDVLVLTSLHEGSPMVVKEALACGLPIVSVDVGDVAERVQGLEGCRIVPAEVDSIAAALGEALDRGLQSGGRRAVEALSLDRIARRLVMIYRGVLQRPTVGLLRNG